MTKETVNIALPGYLSHTRSRKQNNYRNGPCGVRDITPKERYLKILEFRHFERHIVFSQSERKEKKKAISNGVNVQVVVRV